ncbi:unknown [Bacteroides sp. CAG:633]|nr:unknown [Bacteroides sp. CAG:633]
MLTAKGILSQAICCYTLATTNYAFNKQQITRKEAGQNLYRNPILPNNFMLSPVPPF